MTLVEKKISDLVAAHGLLDIDLEKGKISIETHDVLTKNIREAIDKLSQ